MYLNINEPETLNHNGARCYWDVINEKTGEHLNKCVEVDTDRGYAVCFVDPPQIENEELKTYTLKGQFSAIPIADQVA